MYFEIHRKVNLRKLKPTKLLILSKNVNFILKKRKSKVGLEVLGRATGVKTHLARSPR